MADWIDRAGEEDRPPPPPELAQWLKVKQWGGDDVMRWPARTFARMRLARNVYESWSAYTSAANRVAWSRKPANAGSWAMVGQVKQVRREVETEAVEVGRVERWGEWLKSSDE